MKDRATIPNEQGFRLTAFTDSGPVQAIVVRDLQGQHSLATTFGHPIPFATVQGWGMAGPHQFDSPLSRPGRSQRRYRRDPFVSANP